MISAGKNATLVFAGMATLVALVACQPKPGMQNPEDDPGFRTLVYTNEFRERFGLAQDGVFALDPGLLAIAVRVEPNTFLGPRCFVDLYLRDEVYLDYPEGTSGRSNDVSPWGMLFFAKLSPADDEAQDKRWRKQRWMFRSRSYSERDRLGIMERASLESFARDILPGLNVVTLDPMCFTLDPRHGSAQIWLRRPGDAKNPLSVTAPDTEHAYAFSVPEALLEHAGAATRAAANAPSRMVQGGTLPMPKFSVPPRAKQAR